MCGFYVCEYLRQCTQYSKSWRQLKKAQDWWEKEKVDQDFRQTVADICKFVTESAHEGRPPFSHTESDLALNEKYKNIRNWSNGGIKLTDYIIPDIFSLP
jgi:hypothetical protein